LTADETQRYAKMLGVIRRKASSGFLGMHNECPNRVSANAIMTEMKYLRFAILHQTRATVMMKLHT
jgi:hypothetical protein